MDIKTSYLSRDFVGFAPMVNLDDLCKIGYYLRKYQQRIQDFRHSCVTMRIKLVNIIVLGEQEKSVSIRNIFLERKGHSWIQSLT